MRIFDNPNHPQYGPVRRMWVVLAQLDLLVAAEAWGERHGMTWDGAMVDLIEPLGESGSQRWLLRAII